jgi:hypothetical protein
VGRAQDVPTTSGGGQEGDSTEWLPTATRAYLLVQSVAESKNQGGRVSGQRARVKACWLDPHAFIEILRIANAIGNAAAQSSAMNQNARGPNAP